MKKITSITFDNYKSFIGKKVEVSISCYEGGMMYPDNNILAGMNEDYYYFLSEQGTEDEVMWHWGAKEEKKEFGKVNCSIEVWDYEEYKAFYESNTETK